MTRDDEEVPRPPTPEALPWRVVGTRDPDTRGRLVLTRVDREGSDGFVGAETSVRPGLPVLHVGLPVPCVLQWVDGVIVVQLLRGRRNRGHYLRETEVRQTPTRRGPDQTRSTGLGRVRGHRSVRGRGSPWSV